MIAPEGIRQSIAMGTSVSKTVGVEAPRAVEVDAWFGPGVRRPVLAVPSYAERTHEVDLSSYAIRPQV